jgi:hypothetical protein
MTSIQDYYQKLDRFKESQKNVNTAFNELENEINRIKAEESYYFSQGCTKQSDTSFLCPPNVKKFADSE